MKTHNDPEGRKFFSWIFSRIIHRNDILFDQDPKFLKQNLLNKEFKLYSYIWLPTNRFAGDESSDWFEFFDALGNLPGLEFSSYYWHTREVFVPYLEFAYKKDNQRLGILRLIAMCSAIGISTQLKLPIIEICDEKSVHYCLSSVLINLSDASIDEKEIRKIVSILPSLLDNGKNKPEVEAIMCSLESYVHKTPQLLLVITEIEKLIQADDWIMQARLSRVRQRLVQNRPSGFDEICLRDLRLPSITEHIEEKLFRS